MERLEKLERHSANGAFLHVCMAETSKVLEPSILEKVIKSQLAA
jgi:hypothetical protein